MKWGGRVAAVALVTSSLVSVDTAPARAATTPLYSGGATFPELAYRDLFNCYGNNSGANLPSLGTPPSATTTPVFDCTAAGFPFNPNVELLYSGVGSGNGKKAFDAHDAGLLVSGSRTPGGPDAKPQGSSGDFGPFFGQTSGVQSFPGAHDPYPTFHFAGSDDPLVQSDLNKYHGVIANDDGVTVDQSVAGGAPIQFPALVSAAAVAFQPPTGTFIPKGAQPKGGSSKVQFSRKTWCGIFTGNITDWNDASITADNKGTSITGGVSKPISVVYRSDGSGTTFIFSNAVIHQCGNASHHDAELNPDGSHPNGFYVPDAWLTAQHNTISKDPNIPTNPADPAFHSNNDFFLNLDGTHQAAADVPGSALLPTNFIGKSGNGGIQAFMDLPAQAGAIGYLSQGFTRAFAATDSGGNPTPLAANLQSWANVVAVVGGVTTTKKYIAPTVASATAVMAKAVAPSTKAACPGPQCFTDPLAWGATDPLPLAGTAFPIGGFTFIDTYTCVADSNTLAALVGPTAGTAGYFTWYYGATTVNAGIPKSVLAHDGASPVPGPWISAIKKLILTNGPTKIALGNTAKTGCVGHAGL